MLKVNGQKLMVNDQWSMVKSQSGFIALTSTLIISAVILLLVVGVFTVSIIEIDKSKARYNSENARAWANLCTEEALQEIRDISGYTGSNEFKEGEDYGCSFTVFGAFPKKIVQSTGFFQEHTRRLKVTISNDSPLLIIESWEEVTEF